MKDSELLLKTLRELTTEELNFAQDEATKTYDKFHSNGELNSLWLEEYVNQKDKIALEKIEGKK